MTHHVSSNCPNRDIECEYHYAGCDFKKPKQQLELHMKDSVSLHLSLVSNSFSLKEKEVSELKNDLIESKKTVNTLKTMLETQRKIVKSIVIASVLFAILLIFLNMWQIGSSMKEDVSTQLWASKPEVMNLSQRLDYPSLPVLIKYAELNKYGDRLLSTPFYTCASESCTSGYLLTLAVYSSETGIGTNTHMSVFIHLLKGKYDNILSWPFGGVVEVIIHYAGDQKGSCVIDFSKFSDIGSRVLNRTMSTGLGCHLSSHKDITMNDNKSLYFTIKVLSLVNSASYWMSSLIIVLIVSVVCTMLAKCIQ